jgi:two-component system, sensor histidine kinase and response regulator
VLFFAVKDNGSGIAPEHKELIFEPFSQADASSTRKHEGTGLGLSICKQLVAMMGGEIGVESEPGKGSTFFFTVRLRRLADLPAQNLVVPPDIQGAHALVVDDLADSRTIMRKMLTSLGFSVETISSGAEALARLENDTLRSNPIELIMMDWRMPGMDGIAVAKKIRRELGLTVPIIMMTAYGKEAERAAAEQAGINGFLIKPIYPSTLFDAIMDAFGKEGFRGSARPQRFTTRASMYRAPLKGIRVLVAEDNPTNQQVAQAILTGAGIAVTIANNGEEAVRAIAEGTFDAVLMDVQMPRMNGYEATRQIRRLPHGASIPIVAMTAHAMKGDEEKCLEAGMDGYISKPVNQDRLFATLWRLLRTRTASGPFHLKRIVTARPVAGRTSAAKIRTSSPDHPTFTPTGMDSPMEKAWAAAHPEDAAGAAQAPPISLPPHLPGIDIAGTQTALAIDGTTYERILVGFGADNRDAPPGSGKPWRSGTGSSCFNWLTVSKGAQPILAPMPCAPRPRILKWLAVNRGRRPVRCRKSNLWFPIGNGAAAGARFDPLPGRCNPNP